MSTRDWLRRLIAHWDEFGPAYGFSELIDLAEIMCGRRNAVRRSARRRRPPRERAEFPAGGFHSLSSLCPAVHWAVAAPLCPRFRPNLAGGRSHDRPKKIDFFVPRPPRRVTFEVSTLV